MKRKLLSKDRERGQGMVELALILVLVALVAIISIQLTGNELYKTYEDVQAAVQNPGDAGGDAPYTCPDGSTAVLHGHKYHCYHN